MSMLLRRRLAFSVLVFALLLAVAWSWNSYQQSGRRLQATMAETDRCQQLAMLLQQRQEVPVETAEMPVGQLNQRVTEAVSAAGLTDRAISNIRPQALQAVRGSSYQQQNVELGLRGLTLEQLVRFLYCLRNASPQLQIATLTVHEPKGLGAATVWNVEPLVLTYRISGLAGKAANP